MILLIVTNIYITLPQTLDTICDPPWHFQAYGGETL